MPPLFKFAKNTFMTAYPIKIKRNIIKIGLSTADIPPNTPDTAASCQVPASFSEESIRRLPKCLPGTAQATRQTCLQRYTQAVQLHRHGRKQACRKKALQRIYPSFPYAPSSILILYPTLKPCYHKTCHIQSPCQTGKKHYDCLYPFHFKQVCPHISHLSKKASQKSYDLSIDPVRNLPQDRVRNKIPYKHLPLPCPFLSDSEYLPYIHRRSQHQHKTHK